MNILIFLLVHSLLAAKYRVVKTLGSGCAAVVHKVVNSEGSAFALKRSKRKSLDSEYETMKLFSGILGFPKVYDFVDGGIVMQLIGPSLSHVMRQSSGVLPLVTVGSIGIQLIDRIEVLHAKKIVHGDLFRNNIAIGSYSEDDVIYVFDFGQVSANRAPKFDIQSVAFTIAGLAGKADLLADNFHSFRSADFKIPAAFIRNTPEEIVQLVEHAHSGRADYDKMRAWMENLVVRGGGVYKGKIIWGKSKSSSSDSFSSSSPSSDSSSSSSSSSSSRSSSSEARTKKRKRN